MKSLNKKISVVVLTGFVVTGSGLSQVFVAHANYDLLNQYLLKNPYSMPIADYFNYICVKSNQEKHRYDALYLGNYNEFFYKFMYKVEKSSNYKFVIPKRGIPTYYYLEHSNKYFLLEFNDEWDFLKKIKEFDNYRHIKDPIIIKVGNSYFNIFFKLTNYQRKVIPVKELAKEYGFRVEYAEKNDFYGKISMQSYIENRYDIKGNQNIINKLIKEPSDNDGKLFKNAETFAYALQNYINIPNGLSRYRIGDYDFIIKK